MVHKIIVGQMGGCKLAMELIYTYITKNAKSNVIMHNEHIAMQAACLIFNLCFKCDENRQGMYCIIYYK